MSAKVRRREFISLLGGAAAAWPLAARAQWPARMRRICVLLVSGPELGAVSRGARRPWLSRSFVTSGNYHR
jgi:hypothetical protein